MYPLNLKKGLYEISQKKSKPRYKNPQLKGLVYLGLQEIKLQLITILFQMILP